MEELVKKIDELKELMIASNVTHIMIDMYHERKDKNSDVVNNFKTSILQDDRNIPCRYSGGYAEEYRRM